MINTLRQDTFEQVLVAPQRTLPAAPFPRKYVHSVFDDLQDALQAAYALQTAGYNPGDVYIMTILDYVEAVEHSQTFLDSISSSDFNVYRQEMRRGSTILAVRLSGYGQIEQMRSLLAPHRARLVKYIDTWTVADLIS